MVLPEAIGKNHVPVVLGRNRATAITRNVLAQQLIFEVTIIIYIAVRHMLDH